MTLEYLHSKIHMAVVTETDINYEGSLTLDPDLMEAAWMRPFQKVLISNCSNTNRFETYLIEGRRGSGEVCLNGPAANLGRINDKLVVMTFCMLSKEEAAKHVVRVVAVGEKNVPVDPVSKQPITERPR